MRDSLFAAANILLLGKTAQDEDQLPRLCYEVIENPGNLMINGVLRQAA
jgi:hypothetical protein